MGNYSISGEFWSQFHECILKGWLSAPWLPISRNGVRHLQFIIIVQTHTLNRIFTCSAFNSYGWKIYVRQLKFNSLFNSIQFNFTHRQQHSTTLPLQVELRRMQKENRKINHYKWIMTEFNSRLIISELITLFFFHRKITKRTEEKTKQ